jgi:mitogen-activated protein kinase 7
MSAQDRETLAAAQARATTPASDSGMVASIAETAVHPPNHHMEVDDLERELSGAV